MGGAPKPKGRQRVYSIMGRHDEDALDMLAFQAGEERAFHRLFEKYRRPILNYLYRFFWNQAIAEELTQEVFLRVCRGAKGYEPRVPFRYWIYQIAANAGLLTWGVKCAECC